MKNRFRRKVLYALALLIRSLFKYLPPSWGIGVGSGAGTIAFRLLKKERQKTLSHLTMALGQEKTPEEIRRIGKSVFRNLGKTAAELIYFPKLTRENVDRWVTFEGLSRLDGVLEKGKGGILLVAHFGNWELLARALGLKGYGGTIIKRKLYDERFDRLLSDIRRIEGIRYLDRNSSPKEMLAPFRENQFLGILADQDIDSVDGIFVPFFGRQAYTPVAPARFSLSANAPIVPCFMIRLEDGRHRLVVEEPIQAEDGVDREEAVRRLTERWMGVTEHYIRRYPEQWVWMHRRWKTRKDRPKTQDSRPKTQGKR